MKFEKDISLVINWNIALDIHKEYVLAGGQNARQEWMMPPRRNGIEKFRGWATANLRQGDAVVIETTANVWDIYDIVAPLVTWAVVAHAGAVRQIAEARVKTDKEDVKRLIRLLIADIVPEVWVPPMHVRELRGMISYRNRLVKTMTMIRNCLQSLIHRHNLILPKGALTDPSGVVHAGRVHQAQDGIGRGVGTSKPGRRVGQAGGALAAIARLWSDHDDDGLVRHWRY